MATSWHSGVHRRPYDVRSNLANDQPYWNYTQQAYSHAQCQMTTAVPYPPHHVSTTDQPSSGYRTYAEVESNNYAASPVSSTTLPLSARITPLQSPPSPLRAGYAIDSSGILSHPTYPDVRGLGIVNAISVRQQTYDETLVSPTSIASIQRTAPVATILKPPHGFIASPSDVQGGHREAHLHCDTNESPLVGREIIHGPVIGNNAQVTSMSSHPYSTPWKLGGVHHAGNADRPSGFDVAGPGLYQVMPNGAPGPQFPGGQSYGLNATYPLNNIHDTSAAGPVVRSSARRQSSSRRVAPQVPATFKERQKKTRVVKRQGPLPEKKRQKTHRMRSGAKMGRGICLRCRLYKTRCDEGTVCLNCLKNKDSARVCPTACIRERIEFTNIVRRCNGRFAQPEADFLQYPWKNAAEYFIDFEWNLPGLGPVGAEVRVACREYEPEGSIQDATRSEWETENGVVRVQQPAYAVFDTVQLQTALEKLFVQHLHRHFHKFKEWILDRTRYNRYANATFQEAFRLNERGGPGSELVGAALRVQWLSIISQGYGSIRFTDIPGLNEYDYRAMGRSAYEAYNRNSSDRPLPQAVTHACDVSILKLLKQAEARCVKLLSEAIFRSGVKPWYSLCIALCVIVWNMEFIHSGAEGYILSKVHTQFERQVTEVVREQMRQWESSFNVILAHWRVSLRDFRPFKLARENPEALRTTGHLPDEWAFQYVKLMVAMLDDDSLRQYPPPTTGPSALTSVLGNKWMMKLVDEAGGSSVRAGAML